MQLFSPIPLINFVVFSEDALLVVGFLLVVGKFLPFHVGPFHVHALILLFPCEQCFAVQLQYPWKHC